MIYPLFAMVLLTFCLMFLTFVTRVKAVKAGSVELEYFKLFQGLEEPERVRVTSRHYTNLFEAPVLFYTAAILAIALKLDCSALPFAAWGYVAFRLLHSIIHLTYNKVVHRIVVFMAGNITLAAMWVIIGYQTI